MDQKVLKDVLLKFNRYSYLTYDYANAIKFANNNRLESDINIFDNSNTYYWNIPVNILNKFKVWKIGKLWGIDFLKDGSISYVKIGKSPSYSRRFYSDEFGVSFKPIIFVSDDEYDLIANGLAIQDTL